MTEDQKDRREEPSTSRRILRGCGIALGVTALIFFFIVGACFVALSGW